MRNSASQRVRKRRENLRASGLRSVQIWVPDSRRPGFAEECRRQSRLIATVDGTDHELHGFMDAVLTDLEGEM